MPLGQRVDHCLVVTVHESSGWGDEEGQEHCPEFPAEDGGGCWPHNGKVALQDADTKAGRTRVRERVMENSHDGERHGGR